ncbi:MAG TPA: DUF2807 domain-containing protein [Rhizomicrobium sp.]
MQNRTTSFWGGAAVAALLVTAGGADAGQDRTWTQPPAQTFNAHTITLDHVIADVTIAVRDGGPATVSIQGPRYLVNEIHAQGANNALTITGPDSYGNNSVNVWDWTKWFDYSDVQEGHLKIALTVARGSDVNARHMIGDLSAGDLGGHLYIETISGDVKVGRVADAKLKVVGGGDISVAGVQNSLQLDIAGSGDVKVGNVGGAAGVTVAGSGNTTLGTVGSGVNANIAGSGDLVVQNVNGPVSISMAGSGDVKIAGGNANPLKISMVGGGDFSFAGTAVNPTISAIGSGDVWLAAYTGHLSSSGMADVRIGKDHDSDDDDNGNRHHMRMPPVPPVPPLPRHNG